MRALLAAVAIVIAALLPFFASTNQVFTANLVCTTAVVVIGLNFMIANTGLVSLGQAALTAAGAYTTAILMTTVGLPAIIALPASCVAGGLIGLILALPSVRIKGPYFAIITIILGWAVPQVLRISDSLTGGYRGIFVDPFTFGGLPPTVSVYYLSLAVLVLAIWVTGNLQTSEIGRALRVIKTNRQEAATYGINVVWMQTAGVTVGMLLAGLGGGLLALNTGAISPANFTVTQSIYFLIAAVVGGTHSPIGAVLGAFLVQQVLQQFAGATYWSAVVLGAILLVSLVMLPRGLMGLLEQVAARLGSRRGRPQAHDSRDAPPAEPRPQRSDEVSNAT